MQGFLAYCIFLQFNTLHGATPHVKWFSPAWMMMSIPFPTPIWLEFAVAVILCTTSCVTEWAHGGVLWTFWNLRKFQPAHDGWWSGRAPMVFHPFQRFCLNLRITPKMLNRNLLQIETCLPSEAVCKKSLHTATSCSSTLYRMANHSWGSDPALMMMLLPFPTSIW